MEEDAFLFLTHMSAEKLDPDVISIFNRAHAFKEDIRQDMTLNGDLGYGMMDHIFLQSAIEDAVGHEISHGDYHRHVLGRTDSDGKNSSPGSYQPFPKDKMVTVLQVQKFVHSLLEGVR